MNKSLYLLYYFIMLVSFFNVKPFGSLALIGRGFPILIMELIWLWYGKNKYIRRPLNLYKREHSHFDLKLFVFLLPSMIMAYLLFHQGIIQSIISYRNLLLFLAIPVFFKIEFSPKNIIRACCLFTLISLFFSLLQTFGFSFIFTLTERKETLIDNQRLNDSEILKGGLAGIELVLIALYYYCNRMYKVFSKHDFFMVLFLFGVVFIAQNRSTLFPAALVVAITFLLSDMKSKLLKISLVSVIGIIAIYILKDSLTNLIEETSTQLTSTYDPRLVATAYFLDFDRMSIGEILFGTGNISFKTSSYVQDLQEAHIHYSDVGFIGFWSQYGILPVALFIYYLIKGIISIKLPGYVRLTAAHILICGVTISYFDVPIHMIWFILYFYLQNYYIISRHQTEPIKCPYNELHSTTTFSPTTTV